MNYVHANELTQWFVNFVINHVNLKRDQEIRLSGDGLIL
jgi:hypothetical protein